MDLRGIFAPITTPLRNDEIDVAGLRSNVERWAGTDLAGIVALGSNGEAPQLDDDESDRVIAVVREALPSDRLLIAGTARESTRGTIAATGRAANLGADAVLVRTPSFFKSQMTSDVLVRHYQAVADASPIPVLLYNFTAVTGVNLLPAAVAKLSGHPNIIGVKESGGDIGQVAAYVDQTPADFAVVVGSAPTLYPSFCVGAVGAIVAAACVLPDLCVRLYRATRDGRHAEARELQRQLTPLARAVTVVHGVPGLKAALDLVGYVGGDPRPPLRPAPPSVVDELRGHIAVHSLP